MGLKVYNSLSRNKEDFVPLEKDRVKMYVCGPTVYDYPHIGHAKSYIAFDIVVRYLRYSGYNVRYVQNITDVGHLLDSGEDRILKGASRERVEPMEIVERYTRAYFDAMDALNVLRPDISPHAAAHIPEQIEFVEKLIEQGYGYLVNGSVYFDVTKWKQYGKLSGRKVEDQQAGARIDINEEKKHAADFALWKKAETGHLMQWNSPWGRGYPGWHIECSAMSMKYLGETFDIHGGGMENQFPHHECEIAQSEAKTGKPFARYWLHNNMVLVDGIKMSKSLGNFTTISQAMEKFSGEQIRFFILQTHYRSPVDFSDSAIEAAGQGLDRLLTGYRKLEQAVDKADDGELDAESVSLTEQIKSKFETEMNDDFNSPAAIGHLFDFVRELNKYLTEETIKTRQSLELLKTTFKGFLDDVLGLLPKKKSEEVSVTPIINILISVRNDLRASQQWSMADKIRDELLDQGIVLEDKNAETKWRIR